MNFHFFACLFNSSMNNTQPNNTEEKPRHWFSGFFTLLCLGVALYLVYRCLRSRRRTRAEGFLQHNTKTSFFSSIFGNAKQDNSIYDPINDFNFEENELFDVEGDFGIDTGEIGRARLKQGHGVEEDADELLKWAEANVGSSRN